MLCFLVLLTGCHRDESDGEQAVRPSKTEALYGVVAAAPSTNLEPARPMTAEAMGWTNAPFAVLQTELSPATLIHSSSSYMALFANMEDYGLGGPTHVAFSAMSGPKGFKRGDDLPVIGMEENWLIVWFAGAAGWTNWDSAWAVFLQRKPLGMILDESGLHIQFSQGAGDVVMMPLYGYEKLPLAGTNQWAGAAGAARRVKTWEWADFLPRDLLMRVRYWASATREFPIYCRDTFQVDRAKDAVIIRQDFEWHSIRDDWRTRVVKLAPVSPTLALALREKENGFPARISAPYLDFEYVTAYGPYLGIEGADRYEITFPVLQYVNELEAFGPPGTNGARVATRALARLREVAAKKFSDPDSYHYDHGGLGNFCWAVMGDQWYAKGLPYYEDRTRSNAVASLRRYFRNDVLVPERFQRREYPRGSGQVYSILEGPGIESWGALGDAGKFSANLLETIWAYAHYTGDWELVRERWDLIKTLFTTPAEARWAGFGRDAIAELGDEAAPCVAMARLAYQAGDLGAYHYACSMFARELVHLYVKQRGASYFRKHQPRHSMEAMDGEVYLTNLWGDTAGWQIDGPEYPEETGERQFNNRWVRFSDTSVARFYRDVLGPDVAVEMERLTARWEARRRHHNDSHIMPSLVQLRSLLLNESPERLEALAGPDRFTGPPSGIIASCLAVIRASRPTTYQRLIPAGSPSPFVTGVERDVLGPHPHLVTEVMAGADEGGKELSWPLLAWWKSWRTPTGQRWNFGQVRPSWEPPSGRARAMPLNWNTQVLIWEEAEGERELDSQRERRVKLRSNGAVRVELAR